MEMYFATNEDNKVIGMSSTMIGKSKEPIVVDEEILEELMVDMSGYMIIENKLIKSNELFLSVKKEAKKTELSLACQECILRGFKCVIRNEEYHLSYDSEAQTNLTERWQLFQNNMIDSIVVTGHTLEGEDVRLEMDKKEFDKLYLTSVLHKESCIKKLRDDLFPLLDSSNGIEDIESIHWDTKVLTPKPETVIIKDDKLLNQEIQRLESETALGTNEIMNLMFMLQMQGMF